MNGTSRTNRFSAIAYQLLNIVSESHDELCSECPFCNGASTLYFNDVKGLWVCFKCGAKGTAKTLVKQLNGTYTEPELELEHISDQLRSLDARVDSAERNTRTISDSQLSRFRRPGEVHDLWGRRGFDSVTCDRWELGYDFIGNALTLPYRDPFTGHVAGIIRRRTVAQAGDGPRYLFPSGFARRSSLYGSWIVHDDTIKCLRHSDEPVILTEGPTDAAKTDQALRDQTILPVSQYGSSITEGQIRLLHRLGVQNLILFYDYDRAGLSATHKGEDLASEFMVERVRWNRDKYCWHRRVCGCPDTSKDQWKEHTWALPQCPSKRDCQCGRIHEPDPGSLSEKEIIRMVERRVAV